MPVLLQVEWITLGYLAYVTAVAWFGSRPRRARLATTSVLAIDGGLILVLAVSTAPAVTIAREWLPGLQILVGYWLSGLLFVRPMPRVERWLIELDQWIGARVGAGAFVERAPRFLLEVFEFAYMTVSPMLPIGFGVVFALASPRDADRFWTVVTAATFCCYGMLPWIQTRPPFAITDMSPIETRSIRARALTRAVMGRASIYWNTLPSGHAAGSVATALAVWDQVPAAGPFFLAWSALIVVGSVAGRYHYVVDAVTGVMVAVASWLVFGNGPS